jgi:hypothetical protein
LASQRQHSLLMACGSDMVATTPHVNVAGVHGQLKLRKYLKAQYTPAQRHAKAKGNGGQQRRRRALRPSPAHSSGDAKPEESTTLGHRMLHLASAAASLVGPLWTAPRPAQEMPAGTGLRRAVSLNAMHNMHTHSSFSAHMRLPVSEASAHAAAAAPGDSRQTHSAAALSNAATSAIPMAGSADKPPVPEKTAKGGIQKRRRGGGGRGGGGAASAAAAGT